MNCEAVLPVMVRGKKFLCAVCALGLVADVYAPLGFLPFARGSASKVVQVPHTHPAVCAEMAECRGLLVKLNQHMLAVKDGRKVSQDMVEDLRCELRNYTKRAQDVLTDADALEVAKMLAAGAELTKRMRGVCAKLTQEDLREEYVVSDADVLDWYREKQRELGSKGLLRIRVLPASVRNAFARYESRDAVLRCIAVCRLREWSSEMECQRLTRDASEALLRLLTPQGIERYVQSFDVYRLGVQCDYPIGNKGFTCINIPHALYAVQYCGSEELLGHFNGWLRQVTQGMLPQSDEERLNVFRSNPGYNRASRVTLTRRSLDELCAPSDLGAVELQYVTLVTSPADCMNIMLIPQKNRPAVIHTNELDLFARSQDVYRCLAQGILGESDGLLDYLTDDGIRLFVSCKNCSVRDARDAIMRQGNKELIVAFKEWSSERADGQVVINAIDKEVGESVVLTKTSVNVADEIHTQEDLCAHEEYVVDGKLQEQMHRYFDTGAGSDCSDAGEVEWPSGRYWWQYAYLKSQLWCSNVTRGGGGDARQQKRLVLEQAGFTVEMAREIAKAAVPSLPEALNESRYYYFPHECLGYRKEQEDQIIRNDHSAFNEPLDSIFVLQKSTQAGRSDDGGVESSTPGSCQNGPFVKLRIDTESLRKLLDVNNGSSEKKEDDSDKKLLDAFQCTMREVFVKIAYGESPIKPLVPLLNDAAAILRGVAVYRGYFYDLAVQVVELHLRAMSRTKYSEWTLANETKRALSAVAKLRGVQYYDHDAQRLTHQPTDVSARDLAHAAFTSIDAAFDSKLREKIAANLDGWAGKLGGSYEL